MVSIRVAQTCVCIDVLAAVLIDMLSAMWVGVTIDSISGTSAEVLTDALIDVMTVL